MTIIYLFTVSLIIIAISVSVILIMRKKRNRSKWGFRDVVKDPSYWKDFSKANAELESNIKNAENWDDEKVEVLTREYILNEFSGGDLRTSSLIFKNLGVRTHPIVLGLLLDSSLYAQIVKPVGEGTLQESPFQRACDLLGDSPKSEIVETLAPFLDDPSKWIRSYAALTIAKTGAASITPYIRKALSDDDESVRTYALMGIEFPINRSYLANSVKDELFSEVVKVFRPDRYSAEAEADILYSLNPQRAKEYFLSPEVFTAESRILSNVLEVLANKKEAVPRNDLLSLITSLDSQVMNYCKTSAMGQALRLLGQHQNEQDKDLLQGYTDSEAKYVAEGAAEGLLCMFGLDGFQQRIWEKEKQSGYEALTKYQQFYYEVFMCNAEINNGGLAQYFLNYSGDRWPDALAGFKAMGFEERHTILNEALGKFGESNPSTDNNERRVQLSKLYKHNDSIFDSLDGRYYNSSEVVEVFAARFVIKNPKEFQ